MTSTTTPAGVVGEATVGELEDSLRGQVIRPGDSDYDQARRVWNAVTTAPGNGHPLRRHRRCDQSGGVCAQPGPAGGGAGRFAQHRRVLDRRRRGGHRSITHDGGHRRPATSPCRRAGRRHLGRFRPRNPGLRPRGHRWAGLHHRARRVHPRRWYRLAAASPRPDLRQLSPRMSSRPTGGWSRERGGERRPVLGVARGRRQLRCGHLWSSRCIRSVPRCSEGCCSSPARPPSRWHRVAGPDPLDARRAQHRTRPDHGAAGALPPRVGTRHACRDHRRVHCGPLDSAEEAVSPLRTLAEPILDHFGPVPYVAMQQALDPLWSAGAYNYFTSAMLDGLSDAAIDELLGSRATKPTPQSELHVHHAGGAMARVPGSQTAFSQRTSPFILNVIARAVGDTGFDGHTKWARDTRTALAAYGPGSMYVNFTGDADEDKVRASYPAETYSKLVAIKDRLRPHERVPTEPEHPAHRLVRRPAGLIGPPARLAELSGGPVVVGPAAHAGGAVFARERHSGRDGPTRRAVLAPSDRSRLGWGGSSSSDLPAGSSSSQSR